MAIPKTYNPENVEKKWYKFWMKKGYFKASPNSGKKPYTIVIPPPNVTDILHLGHALNNTIQDIYIRWKRMQGYETEWLPGADHAGIATQVVVEKRLPQGETRESIGREKFLKLVWEWALGRKELITKQLMRMGCSCDWGRIRFTLDDSMSRAVREAFVRLYEKGLIYRGNYIVNWCPRCTSAISDEEVKHKKLDGWLYYIKYPLKGEKGFVTVATTRPETMLGDTGLAVNAQDEKNKKLLGKTAILPLINRKIPIIADSSVDSEFGTGVVKVTPAHDANDFEIGKRHNLKSIRIMDKKGKINQNGGKYTGMDRFEAREAIINDLKELGLLLKVEKHKLSIGYCHRCGTIIEPYLSTQWFVKMKELARPAIRAVEDGEIRFFPQRWKGVYLSWMSNIKDWCISRQLWWGHRIPVWYCKKQQNEKCKQKNGVIVSRTKPEKCPYCGSTDLVQDPDVLDTWFSSWLWPFSTFGWPGNTDDIKFFYPTNFLTTGGEIIFFWVARMIVAGYEFMGNKPFSTVYIHGTVRDTNGVRMQKSLGNGIDPLLIINKYGTDALRFSLIAAAGEGQDPHIQENSFEVGRNFCNKIWNSYRLIERLKREEKREKREGLNLADRWIESRLNYMIMRVTNSLSNYRLNDACMTIYEFFWHEFCDWWLELTKETRNIELAYSILEKTLRILHPFMPFITEEVWQRIPHKGESIMVAEWPMPESLDEKAESDMEVIQNVTRAVRNMKSSHNIPLSRDVTIYIRTDKAKRKIIEENHRYIERLAFVNRMDFESQIPKESALEVIQTIGVFLPLSGLIDVEKEKERLEKEIAILEALLIKTQTKLSNPDFLSKAKKEVVKNTEKKRKEYEEKLNKLKQDISPLS